MPPAPPSFQGCCAPLGAALSRDRAELPAAPGATPDPLRPDRRRPSHSGAKGRAEKQNNVFKNLKQPKPNHQPKAKQLVLGKSRPTAREEQRRQVQPELSQQMVWSWPDFALASPPLPPRAVFARTGPAGPGQSQPAAPAFPPAAGARPGPRRTRAARTTSRPVPPPLTQTPGETVHLVRREAGAGPRGEAAVVLGRDRFIHPRSGGRQRRRRSPALASRPGQRLRRLPALGGGRRLRRLLLLLPLLLLLLLRGRRCPAPSLRRDPSTAASAELLPPPPPAPPQRPVLSCFRLRPPWQPPLPLRAGRPRSPRRRAGSARRLGPGSRESCGRCECGAARSGRDGLGWGRGAAAPGRAQLLRRGSAGSSTSLYLQKLVLSDGLWVG